MPENQFWIEIDAALREKSEFLPDRSGKADTENDQIDYEENLQAIAEIVHDWRAQLQDRKFQIHECLVASKGMKLAFSLHGVSGIGGFASWHDNQGRLIVASIQQSINQLQWSNNPDQNVRIGTGFDVAIFTNFLENNLLTYLDDSNLLLSHLGWTRLRKARLSGFLQELDALSVQPGRQSAGLALERLLNRVFSLEGLAPRGSFCVVGEQIDGAIQLDNETYLVEAKWKKHALGVADLYPFREKIAGKSRFTRGIFIAINGITDGALDALSRGKQLLFFVVTGQELRNIFAEGASLVEHLRKRQRSLSENGQVLPGSSNAR